MNGACNITCFRSPVGTLTIAAVESRVTFLGFGTLTPPALSGGAGIRRRTAFLERVCSELDAWFAGDLRIFSVPVGLSGTSFQKAVWSAIGEIPWGECRSYGEIAREIGRPGAARAVGGACNRNPVPIIIPCHRVIGSDGSLTGFGGGLDIKARLLERERTSLPVR